MPVDFKRRIIFIHIPRTGGTSIEILLNMVELDNFWSPYPLSYLDPSDRTPQHFTYRQLSACLSRDLIDQALVFAFVRNPWERIVSEYEWRRNLYSKFRHNPDRLDLSFLATFESFVRILELTQEERDTWRNFDGHLETQTSFLLDEFGKIGVSTLGRFERFYEDLRMILSRAGVKVTKVPHSNRSGRRNYESYYTNSTHDAVATFYAADIKNFGYTFGK